MKYVLVSIDNVSNSDYYAGSCQFQNELCPYFATNSDIKPIVWNTRKDVEKALIRIHHLYGYNYAFYIKEI